MSIRKILARQIYDSRGNPTVEVDVFTTKGIFRSAVPSGASTGIYEAKELRDGDKSSHHGRGVNTAIDNIRNEIAPKLISSNISILNQAEIDKFLCDLDGTKDKSRLGANAILAVSMAVAKAAAHEKKIPFYRYVGELCGNPGVMLPVPAMNVINGGKHSGNRLAIQEFMIMPVGATSFREAMKMGSEVYHHLKIILEKKHGKTATNVGDEGGFAPDIADGKEALQLVKEAIEAAGYNGRIKIAIDAAASEFCEKADQDRKYNLDFKAEDQSTAKKLTSSELADLYRSYMNEFEIVSLEDPFEQDDFPAWEQFSSSVQIQVVGDDLTVSNTERIQQAIEKKCCNCLLLKVNQIGTLSEAIAAAVLARSNEWSIMVSHRSGETEDVTISDLSVGLGCGQIKTGAPCRTERCCKYNQLLRIEEELGGKAKFAGENFRKPT
ncbi:alpha-enolase-like [Paramacrobiotus metropolitanus]|uniref:alpha-enolase-like n=1 Tax=Paramacrobiotus metropolitanus TaxID=2943436 RepID=UPI002445F2B5|nr:alpha-enolase-like [Paramacrobiotus metropolitanus]